MSKATRNLLACTGADGPAGDPIDPQWSEPARAALARYLAGRNDPSIYTTEVECRTRWCFFGLTMATLARWGRPLLPPMYWTGNAKRASNGRPDGSVEVPPALAADADESGVWLLGPKHVERWRPAPGGQLARVASAALPKPARDVAARSGSALVATADGVHLVTDSVTGVELSPRLPLCGSPYRVAALGSDVWAVATTLGLALVSNADGALRIESMSLLLPHAGGALVPLPVEPSGEPACGAGPSSASSTESSPTTTARSRPLPTRTSSRRCRPS